MPPRSAILVVDLLKGFFKIWGPHCVVGTPDADVVDEPAPRPGDYQIAKKHYSGFSGTRLEAVLRELDVKRVYVTGAWTEACVQHTTSDQAIALFGRGAAVA